MQIVRYKFILSEAGSAVMAEKIRAYKKELSYSYVSGASATYELLKTRPETAECVYIHSSFRDPEKIERLCRAVRVRCERSDKIFNILNQKDNSYVAGVFRKYTDTLAGDEPHVVLVNPSDMGNLGTIIRTLAGFNIKNLAVINPAADIFNPKTIRACMGAIFHIKHACFASFGDYLSQFPSHSVFPFMLGGSMSAEEIPPTPLFSLVFGNEASGLDESFAHIGRSIRIPLSDQIDSFNLSVAVGIGCYIFAKNNMLV